MSMLSGLASTAAFLTAAQQTTSKANVCRVDLALEFVTVTDRQQLGASWACFAVRDRLLLHKKPQQKAQAAAYRHLSGQGLRGLSGRLSEATLQGHSSLGRDSFYLRSKGISREAACA